MLGNRDVGGEVFRLPYNKSKSEEFLRRSRRLLVGSAFASSAPGVAPTTTASAATAAAAAAAAACDGGLARCSSFVLNTVSKYYECRYEYAESTLLLLLLLLLWFLLVSRTKNTRESKIGVHTAPQNALLQAMRSCLNANKLILSATNLQPWWRWW